MKFAKFEIVTLITLGIVQSAFCLETILLVPTAREGGTAWKYMEGSRRSTNWERMSFTDESWKSGFSGFGSGYREVKTPWSGKEVLYLRKEFELEYKVREVQSASLVYAIDDDIEVWLNGTRILKVAHEGRYEYLTVDVTMEFKRLVRETGRRNLIAVKAHNNRGACYVDVGLEVVLADSDRTSTMRSARNPEKQDDEDIKELRLIPTAQWRG